MPGKDNELLNQLLHEPIKSKMSDYKPVVVGSTRLIDRETGTRSTPMRVLNLGMSRTGTYSMYTALKKLGYHPYHMAEAMKDPPRTFAIWNEALRAHYRGEGKVWGREELDKMIGDYDSVCDMPCLNLVEEFVTAYPDAKVILTNRDIDKWLASWMATADRVISWPIWKYVAPWDKSLVGPFWAFADPILTDFAGTDNWRGNKEVWRQAFIDHYKKVRKIVPKENILEFESKDGWEPLCKFLDQPIPNEPYPNTNDSANFVFLHQVMIAMALSKMIAKITISVAPVIAGIWYFNAYGTSGEIPPVWDWIQGYASKLWLSR